MAIQVMKVIVATDERRGAGTPDDPIRIITTVYDMRGRLILEHDPHPAPNYDGRLGDGFWKARGF